MELTLVRHGQAQTGAKDEKSYDQLSDLGHQQANWLGEYINASRGYDRVISGGMRRQIETAQSLDLQGIPNHADERLNELDYFGLAASLDRSHGTKWPTDAVSFAAHVVQLLDVWKNGQMDPGLETYDDFRGRITGALQDATTHDGRVLLVTSTGVIATLVAIALGLDMAKKSKMFLAVAHTSVHKFELVEGELHLTQFGSTPHLDTVDRAYARTFI